MRRARAASGAATTAVVPLAGGPGQAASSFAAVFRSVLGSGLVNRDPYNAGWMIKLKASNPADVNKLLSVEDYLQKTGNA